MLKKASPFVVTFATLLTFNLCAQDSNAYNYSSYYNTFDNEYKDSYKKNNKVKSWISDTFLSGRYFDAWLGLQFGYNPSYMGSDDYKYSVIPLVNFEIEKSDYKASPFFFDSDFGAGIKLIRYNDLFLSTSAFYRFGWDAEDDLEGLQDRDGSIEGFITLGYKNTYGFYAALAYGHGFGGDLTGEMIYAKIAQEVYLSPKLSMEAAGKLTWAGSDYMNGYFGVSESEAMLSKYNLSPYVAEEGFRDIDISLKTKYRLSENIRLNLKVNAQYLFDEASQSPIVKDVGSDISYGASVGISYKF